MKRILFILIGSFLLAGLTWGENLLVNGDFSKGSKGWKFKNKQGAGQGYATNGMVVLSLGKEDGEQKIYQDLIVKPGSTYQLKASYKTEGKPGLYVYFYVAKEEGKWETAAIQGPVLKSPDWKEMTYVIAAKDAVKMRVDFRVRDPEAAASIKNISFAESGASTSAAE